jgi:hypothetical protein
MFEVKLEQLLKCLLEVAELAGLRLAYARARIRLTGASHIYKTPVLRPPTNKVCQGTCRDIRRSGLILKG